MKNYSYSQKKMKDEDREEAPEWCNQGLAEKNAFRKSVNKIKDVIKISQRSCFQNLNVNKHWNNTVKYKF